MTNNTVYEVLNSTDSFEGHEELLKQHLISQVERYDRDDEDPKVIAYELAGLMSAESVFRLPDDNPFKEILSLAGELELPYPHRSKDATWDSLKALVRQLP